MIRIKISDPIIPKRPKGDSWVSFAAVFPDPTDHSLVPKDEITQNKVVQRSQQSVAQEDLLFPLIHHDLMTRIPDPDVECTKENATKVKPPEFKHWCGKTWCQHYRSVHIIDIGISRCLVSLGPRELFVIKNIIIEVCMGRVSSVKIVKPRSK